jgi:hypothetical protein
VRCPFCSLSIDFEFRNRMWIAMRDGDDHACSGLVQALSGAADKRPSNGVADALHQAAATVRQSPAPRVAAGKTVGKATQAPTSARRNGGPRRPVQLELQALD